ncbi:asparagine synthase (glutamine-hydrolyzing) [Gillisia sp. Hel_I_29]|uniref:asparagine synthase (glutamine-hydrolyzing) n=1 Tax=Gillisia sp. Hel_I_29 TaxID=1249975 RepID=UPI00054D6F8A|nr:asparagine synthase (glutamine-hydrolyzing) [Gillisia sp. Hel_I_29]
MCGIAGILHFGREKIQEELLKNMTNTLSHRGPDDSGYYFNENIGFGFKRLSIIDLTSGNQPITNEDGSLIMICNGEIFNYKTLKKDLVKNGHVFKTNTDVEVIVHLYEEHGIEFLNMLNGQFAFALFDKNKKSLFLVRDHVGIAPLFYFVKDSIFYFASEIKGLLQVPEIKPIVDMKGLDQIFTFPGLVSPQTMFKDIFSLKPGNYLEVSKNGVSMKEYWDMDYPLEENETQKYNEKDYLNELDELLENAVKDRLQADVPVGFYLSGGLDSSLIASYIKKIAPNSKMHSFSITFDDLLIDERKYQRLMALKVGSIHHETHFNSDEIIKRLKDAVYYSETPLKESYNTCSLGLSQLAKSNNIKVVLSGEGADELFGGYVGYKFDKYRNFQENDLFDLDEIMEFEYRDKLWGDRNFFYENKYYEYEGFKKELYSNKVTESFEDFNSVVPNLIDKTKIKGRSPLHKRSYIDLKLRMADHLLSGHGDRVGLANSVEMRYPFLDINLLQFLKKMPSSIKLKDLKEKYILKKCAERHLPQKIVEREKFSFVASGSPELINKDKEWINDILSYETIKRQGYFNPDTVERLKKIYRSDDFRVNQTFERDYLMIILTFGIFIDVFKIPDFCSQN